ncbi:MAG: TPM domain-containing protein [Oscillospiraceae bacterium]|nr:TPM domain-containing protein [Oscillospiraceae bacterium]
MIKRLISLLLILLLLAALFPAALAEDAGASDDAAPEETAAAFPYVLDNALLLRDSQRETLEQKAAALSEQHQCSLYIVTVEDHTQYDYDVYEAAKGIFQYYDLGWGEEKNGVILLLSMGERDYAFTGHGDLGETVCNYESSWLIEDKFLDNFRNDDWYGGFSDFLDACDTQLTTLENGGDVSEGADIITGPDGLDYHSYNDPYQNTGRSLMPRLLVVIFVPLVVALIVCLIFKGQMKTAKLATRADEYLVPHSMNLRIRDDVFTHRTESRTLIESDSGSRGGGGGGGGSSFHSGGGFSGRSGKF